MRLLAHAVVTLLLALPALAAAQTPVPTAPGPGSPPQAMPEPAPPPAGAPVPTPESVSPAPAAPDYSAYLILKGGYFGTTGSFQGSSYSDSGTWEVAVGGGKVLGLELASGSMKTKASGLEVTTVPILLSLRLALPIAFLSPFAEAGAGAYSNKATIADASTSVWVAGWHAGLGCDLLLGRLLVGVQARYMAFSPSFSELGSLNMDRFEALLRAGLRF